MIPPVSFLYNRARTFWAPTQKPLNPKDARNRSRWKPSGSQLKYSGLRGNLCFAKPLVY